MTVFVSEPECTTSSVSSHEIQSFVCEAYMYHVDDVSNRAFVSKSSTIPLYAASLASALFATAPTSIASSSCPIFVLGVMLSVLRTNLRNLQQLWRTVGCFFRSCLLREVSRNALRSGLPTAGPLFAGSEVDQRNDSSSRG